MSTNDNSGAAVDNKASIGASVSLCPVQSAALSFLTHWQSDTPILHLSASDSLGKTTVLKEFQRQSGAHWIDVRPFVANVAAGHPLAMEDAVWRVLIAAIDEHAHIIVDDFDLLFEFATGCSGYPRSTYYCTVMHAIRLAASSRNRRIVIGSNGHLPESFSDIAWPTSIGEFGVADYQHLFRQILGDPLDEIDFEAVFRFAPNLNCHRIIHLCHWMNNKTSISTAELLDFIQTQGMASNVQMGQVQQVQLADLCGVDDIITALEDHIIMPLENLKLAAELGLTPKRGVMLAGPPGTGKTTIGRALARRLRGKFFLIDGTVISGTEYFYHRINSIFRMAIDNAPSIVFIDDSDVIFESGREHGLYRYLLTMLDGLESKSASDVCVMMTAMDLGNIPPALVRSGRIELWLEMRLPDDASRRRLMEQLFEDKVRVDAEGFWPEILSATDGFSGADLKRLVQDAKLQMAIDMTRARDRVAFHQYLLRAASVISNSRLAYARAATRAMEVNADRPRWFNIHPELFEKRD
jgi:transitional endoplasmic reticulum ATPase